MELNAEKFVVNKINKGVSTYDYINELTRNEWFEFMEEYANEKVLNCVGSDKEIITIEPHPTYKFFSSCSFCKHEHLGMHAKPCSDCEFYNLHELKD